MTTFNELYIIVQRNHNFPIVSIIKCEEIKIKDEEPFDAGCLFVTDLQSSYDQSQIHETEMKCESLQDEVAQILMRAKTCKLETKKSKTIKRTVNKVDKDKDYYPSKKDENLQFFCKVCKRKFTSESTYQRHVDEAHLEKGFCEKCKIFSTPKTHERHMKLHELEGQVFQCFKCKKDTFRCYFRLKKHHRRCRKRPPKKRKPTPIFVCDICPRTFSNKPEMRRHIEKHQAERALKHGQGFECPQCHKMYGTESILENHIRQVHEKVRHICEICSKETRFLRSHMMSHQDNERVKCPICGNRLKTGLSFRKHMRIHEKSDGKTFPCKECDHVSRTTTALWGHVKNMHRMERTLQCQYCPKKLKTKLDLKEHEATHTVRLKILIYFTKLLTNLHNFRASISTSANSAIKLSSLERVTVVIVNENILKSMNK